MWVGSRRWRICQLKSGARKLQSCRIPGGSCWNTRASRNGTFLIFASIPNTKHWNGPPGIGRRHRRHRTIPRGKSQCEHSCRISRRWGFLQAKLDPLGDVKPVAMPDLDVTGPEADAARRFYCGSIGAEFMHIADPERREWIQARMEAEAPEVDRARILDWLVRAEIFEQVLQTRYLGTKRYSLEGEAALLPLLDLVLGAAAEQGAEKALRAMSHGGRLNVMVHIVGRSAAEVFARFEDVDPRSVLGGGDVKYHMGATGNFTTADGQNVSMHLVSNPSHLEAVDPVAGGRARAKQQRGGDTEGKKLVPIIMHGDAAFAGQGILAETLNMSNVEGFTVGGSIHVVVNNLIGFTTIPRDSHSARFATALALRLPPPIFHVNAEDPDAVVRVGRMALDYRAAFGTPG